MKFKFLTAAAVAAIAAVGTAAQAGQLSVQYFEQDVTVANGDFGVCCSSPPATLPVIALGSGLTNGMPTLAAGSTVVDKSGAELLWWTPGQGGITATGTGTLSTGVSHNMFAPNSTNNNDTKFFETAILKGEVIGNGSDVHLTVAADDDALVYVNGLYVGGVAGVHSTESKGFDLGSFTGAESLEIFYADRAHVDANIMVSNDGGRIVPGVPEASTWAMLILGVAMVGFALRRREGVAVAA